MLVKRSYDIYLRGCGIRKMGGPLRRAMNQALRYAVRTGDVVTEDESGTGDLLDAIARLRTAPPVLVRNRGPRDFREIPPSELQLVARQLSDPEGLEPGSDAHLRSVLDFFDLKRLTVQVGTTLLAITSGSRKQTRRNRRNWNLANRRPLRGAFLIPPPQGAVADLKRIQVEGYACCGVRPVLVIVMIVRPRHDSCRHRPTASPPYRGLLCRPSPRRGACFPFLFSRASLTLAVVPSARRPAALTLAGMPSRP